MMTKARQLGWSVSSAFKQNNRVLTLMTHIHTGDDAPFLSYDERFEHPARTWASSSHRKFTHAAVGIAMAAATFRFMQATAKTAMRRVLGIRGGQGETLVPPTAVAGGDEGFVFEFEASDNNNSG